MYVLHQEYSKEVCPGCPTQSRNLPLPEFLFSQAPHTHSPIVSLSHTHSLAFLLVNTKRSSPLYFPRTVMLLVLSHGKAESVTTCKDRRQQK